MPLLRSCRMRGKGVVPGSWGRVRVMADEPLKIFLFSAPANFGLGRSESACSSESSSPGINNAWRCSSSFGLGHLHLSSDIVTEGHSLGRAVRVQIHPDFCQSCYAGMLCLSRGCHLNRVLLLLQVDAPLQNNFGELVIDFFHISGKRRWNGDALPADGWIFDGFCELALNSIKISEYHLEDVRFLPDMKALEVQANIQVCKHVAWEGNTWNSDELLTCAVHADEITTVTWALQQDVRGREGKGSRRHGTL